MNRPRKRQRFIVADCGSFRPVESDVGYGRPPKHSQFKKGKSGNPAGRPKGAGNMCAIAERFKQERVAVKTEGRSKRMSKIEVGISQQVNRAAQGDLRAINFLLKLEEQMREREWAKSDPASTPEPLELFDADFEAALAAYFADRQG